MVKLEFDKDIQFATKPGWVFLSDLYQKLVRHTRPSDDIVFSKIFLQFFAAHPHPQRGRVSAPFQFVTSFSFPARAFVTFITPREGDRKEHDQNHDRNRQTPR